MRPLRARVTYSWGSWWWVLQRDPGFLEHTCPSRFPTAALAADSARRELERRAEPDPVRRALMRIGIALDQSSRRDTYKLAN